MNLYVTMYELNCRKKYEQTSNSRIVVLCCLDNLLKTETNEGESAPGGSI